MEQHSKATVARQVLGELDAVVLRIGMMFEEVYESPEQFEDWVIEHLPLHPYTAERIRAMSHLYELRPNSDDLPEPHKALWSLP